MKKRKILVFFVSLFLLSSCGQNSNDKENKSKNDDLCLIDFKVKEEEQIKKNKNLRNDNDSTENYYNFVKQTNQSAIAVIKNTNRLSFVDMVVSLNNDKSRVVYNEGNGEYACSSTTIFENELWVTKIEIPFNLEFDEDFHSKVTIESVNFLSLSSEKVEAYMDESNLKTLNFGWIGDRLFNSNGLIYNIVSDVAYVSSYTSEISENLIIPEKINLISAKPMEYYVVGIENYAFKDCISLKEVTFERPSIISKIGEGAFYNCSNLTSINNFPNIKDIEAYLFYNDFKLKNCVQNFSGNIGKYAFYNNENFGNELILDDVENVDEYAFYNCNSIKELRVGTEVNSDKNSFFSSSLQYLSAPGSFFGNESYASVNLIDIQIDLKSSLYSFGKYSNFITKLYLPFNTKLQTLPSALEYLEFENLDLLKQYNFKDIDKVTINSNIDLKLLKGLIFKEIYFKQLISLDRQFYYYEAYPFNADCIVVSAKNLNIPKYAFYECDVKKVILENGVKSIDNSAFKSITTLETIQNPDSLESIGNEAFWSCSSLTSITLRNNVSFVGCKAFAYSNVEIYCSANSKPSGWDNDWNDCHNGPVLWNSSSCQIITNDGINYAVSDCNELIVLSLECTEITELIIPSEIDGMKVVGIGDYAFDSSSITSVILPNTLVTIGSNAFSYCNGLVTIDIPCSVISIGNNAFRYCRLLKTVVMPNSLASIGNFAFGSCNSLATVNIPNSVTSIGSDAFEFTSALNYIYIPNSVEIMGAGVFFFGCSSLIIECQALSMPNGWDSNWNIGCVSSNKYFKVRWGVEKQN